MEDLEVWQAEAGDVATVSDVLLEAAVWLKEAGIPLWDPATLTRGRLLPEVEAGEYWICLLGGEVAGVLKFQLEDELYWPEASRGEAVYVHKLTVCRRFAGKGLAAAMLDWAAKRGLTLGRKFLRLDCEALRDNLRQIYEKFGFEREGFIELGERKMVRFELPLQIHEGHEKAPS